MVVTVPLRRRNRVMIAWTWSSGFSAERLTGCFDPPGEDDRREGTGGVREPRSPRRGGAVALALDEEPPRGRS